MRYGRILLYITFTLFSIFLFSSTVLAAEYAGTFDSFTVDTDYSDSTYVTNTQQRAVYWHTYPINTQRTWYSLYVIASDPIAQTCTIDLQFQGDPSINPITIHENEVYKFLENTVDYQFIGVSGFTNGGICRVAYSFENTNFDTNPDDDETTEDTEENTLTTEQCLDSDGGSDYNVQGTMTHGYLEISLSTGLDLQSPITDYCLDENTLVEHFCADGLYGPDGQTFIHQYAKSCDNGCSEGICLETIKEESDDTTNEDDKNDDKSNNNPFSGILKFIFKLFDGFFDNDKSQLPIGEIQEAQEILIWQVDDGLTDIIEPGVIRAFDQGEFETDITCPDGMLASTIEVAAQRVLGKPQLKGITLYCAEPGDDTVLDTTNFDIVGWGVNNNNGGFLNEADRVVGGLRGYTTMVGLEFIKKLKAQRKYIAQDSEEIVLEDYLNIWSEVPESLSITTSQNSEAFCSGHGANTATGISGLRIFSIERQNEDIISGLQLRCTTLNQVNPVFN